LKQGGDCDEKCVLLANTLSQTLSVPIENMHILSIHTTSNSSESIKHSNHAQLLVQIHDGTFCIMDPISKDGFLVLPSSITDLSSAIERQTNYYQKIAQLNSTPENQLKLSSLRAQPICTFALRQIFSSREKYSNQN
jgi:hypothetical protein